MILDFFRQCNYKCTKENSVRDGDTSPSTSNSLSTKLNYLEKNRSCVNNNMDFVLKVYYSEAILHFLQYLYRHIDSGNVVFSLFLDFHKAFDCVNLEILISKLNTCGVQ